MRNCDTEIETAKHVFLPLPFPCLWKTQSPWQPLSFRSSSYKFWWRICYENLSFLYITGLMTPRWPRETHAPPTFLFSKNRKGKQRKKKERVSKQKLLKGFHQGQNVTVSEHLEFKYFSVFHGHYTLKSTSPALQI